MNFRKCLDKVINPSLRNQVNTKELASIYGPNKETLLHYLSIENYLESVRWLLDQGFDCNTVNRFGNTPLMDVVSLDYEEMVKLLLQTGADPNFQNEHGDTALHVAYESNSSGIIKSLLLDHGARDDLKNDLDQTPTQSQ